MSETSVRLIYAALLILGSVLAGYGIYLAEKADKQRRSLARRMRIEGCWGDREDAPEPKGGFGSRSWRLE